MRQKIKPCSVFPSSFSHEAPGLPRCVVLSDHARWPMDCHVAGGVLGLARHRCKDKDKCGYAPRERECARQ
jgi:hypothetical protein